MNFDADNQVKVVLGDEFDDDLRERLREALRKLGAKQVGSTELISGGTQDIETLNVLVGSHKVHIEAETYVGLAIWGPANLLEEIRRLVQR